jgi:hypothetical protein
MAQHGFHFSPQQRAKHISAMLQVAQKECRYDITQIQDPRAQALFETLAEVLGGAIKAVNDFQEGNEPAWKSRTQPEQTLAAPSRPQPGRTRESAPSLTEFAVDVDAAEPPPSIYNEIPGHNELSK